MDVKRACGLRERGIVTNSDFVGHIWECLQKAPDRRDVYLQLLDALTEHPSGDVRAGVAEVLGSIKLPFVVEPLCLALKDADAGARCNAAKALGQCRDAQALEPLCQALVNDEDSLVRGMAASALGKIGDVRATESLCHALQDKEPDLRRSAAEALGAIKDPAAFDPLCQVLRENDPRVRRCAALALGELADARAVAPLTEALEDEVSDVRESATKALGKIGVTAIVPLCKALENGTEGMQLAATEAVGRLRDAKAVGPLCRALAYSSADARWCAADAVLHWAAVEALGSIGLAAVEPLCRVLGEADARVRRLAGWALVKVGSPAVESLCSMLVDTARDDRARQEAALALGKLRNIRAWEPLCSVLDDKNAEVRTAAFQALGEINGAQVAGPLQAAMERPGTRLRAPAADAEVLADQSWSAAPWDYSCCQYVKLSNDGTGLLVYGYGQTIYAEVRCRWEVPVAGLLRLTYMESPSDSYVPGFTPDDGNRVADLGYRLVEGEVSGIQSLVGAPYKYFWTLELSRPPWPPRLRFPYAIPRVFYGHRQ